MTIDAGSEPIRRPALGRESLAWETYATLPDIGGGEGTLGDRLCAVLEEAIVGGQLPRGMHLKAEALSRRYGMSIIPIRESLRTLQARGWVTIRPHHGAFVKAGSQEELKNLFEARVVIESACARYAAERRSPQDLEDLRAAVEAGKRIALKGSINDYPALNSRFHELIAIAAKNDTLLAYQRQLNQRVRFYFAIVSADRIQQSVDEHAEICSAIAAGDQLGAQALSLAHVGETRQRVSESMSDEGGGPR